METVVLNQKENSMNIDVNINADDINKHVSQAIISSALGEKMLVEINEAINKVLSTPYQNPGIISRVVEDEIRVHVTAYLRTPEVEAKLKAVVGKMMEEKTTDAILAKAVRAFWSKAFES
jgi:hypothetical protein